MFHCQIDSDLELRLLEERHAEALFDLSDRNREYLRQWLPWMDSVQRAEDTKAFIRSSLQLFAENGAFNAGVWHQGELTGVIGYHKIDWANRRVGIGYWLGESFQGKGIITRACRVFVGHAFKELKLNRVEIGCATENLRSQKIPERLSFQREAVLRQQEWLYDHFVDHVIYGMLEEEWNEEIKKEPSY